MFQIGHISKTPPLHSEGRYIFIFKNIFRLFFSDKSKNLCIFAPSIINSLKDYGN